MRNLWIIVVSCGLLINSAFAMSSDDQEKTIIQAFRALMVKNGKVKNVSDMNFALKHLKAKFIIEQAMEYKDHQTTGIRYVVKNVSKKPIYLSEWFGKSKKLLALICSKNILAPNETSIAYVIEEDI